MKIIIHVYPGASILSIAFEPDDNILCPGIGPDIGPCPNGETGGSPNWWPPKGWPDDVKCGFPPTNGGPDELGRPINCGGLLDGEPNGLGPLKFELDVGGKAFGWGPGPGVEEPDGAGEAVYWGVEDPAGAPE